MSRTPPQGGRTGRRVALAMGVGGAAALAAFALGRWSSDPPTASVAADESERPTGGPGPRRWRPPLAPAQRSSSAPPPEQAESAPADPYLTPAGRPTPALVARVTEEASRSLEDARVELVERCVPKDRHGSESGAKYTFNVTFDANGREIARGINEDRRARAPEIASCLRRMPLGTLQVPAPGASVGVRVGIELP